MRIHQHLYILAAVIVADADAEGCRDTLRAPLLRGQSRLHWRDESTRRRSQLITGVQTLQHTGAVVIAAGVIAGRQERARRKCIEHLLFELTSRGITQAVFERRHEELDARDRTLIAALQRQRSLPVAFRTSWRAATEDPLLWLADIAAGAASLAEAGDEQHWEHLAAAFTIERFMLA